MGLIQLGFEHQPPRSQTGILPALLAIQSVYHVKSQEYFEVTLKFQLQPILNHSANPLDLVNICKVMSFDCSFHVNCPLQVTQQLLTLLLHHPHVV